MKKKITALLLCMALVLSLLPAGVQAERDAGTPTETTVAASDPVLGTEQSPYLITTPEQIYALARILTTAPTGDTDAVLTEALKADYALFSVSSGYVAAYTALQTAHYKLGGDITLTNHTNDVSNGYYGIPNFAGTFDGDNKTITLTIIIDKYPKASTNYYGGLFSTLINGAVVENITFDGTVTAGTADAYFSTPGFRFGTLFGIIPIGEDQHTTISNITNNASITMYLTGVCGEGTGGIGGLGGYHSGESFTDCTNNGNIQIFTKDITASPRFGGMVGNGCRNNSAWTRCVNNGDIIAEGTGTGTYCVGDMAGSGGMAVFTDCVSAGKLQSVGTFSKIFEGITSAGRGNIIRLSFTGGTAGEVLSYSKDPNIRTTVASNGTATLDIPVFVNEVGSIVNQKFDAKNYIQVSGKGAIYYFHGDSKTLTTDLSAQAGAVIAAPFSTEETALKISEPKHLLWLQQAINEGNHDAINSLMALAGLSKPADNSAYAVVRAALNSGFIKLTDNITFTEDIGFTGIGTIATRYAGSIDGNGHTLAYIINHTLTNTSPTLFGLIGYSSETPSIKNITVEPTITIIKDNRTTQIGIGGIAAYADNSFTVGENVTVNIKSIVSDALATCGGVFGCLQSFTGAPTVRLQGDMLDNSETRYSAWGVVCGQVTGKINVEGITLEGEADRKIQGSEYVGSVIGYNSSPATAGTSTLHKINADKALFSVKSTLETGVAGALIGRANETTISISGYKNRIPVTAAGTAGGIMGSVSGITSSSVTLTDCENLAAINGVFAGGLIGLTTSATATVNITDSCNYGALTGKNLGGLIGYNAGSTLTFEDAVYLKTAAVTKACGNVATDPTGIIALDTTKIPATATYGDSIEKFLTAASPVQLTILPADSVSVDGTGKLTFTKAGDVVVSAKWNGTEIYNSGTITVAQKDISTEAAISGVLSAYPHTGSAITPVPTVKDGDTVLTLGTDYTLEYSANTAAGTATITVTFKGNYTGTATKTFTIDPNALTVTADGYTGAYDGQPHGISVTAKEKDVTVKYSTTAGNYAETALTYTNVGTYTVYYEVSKTGSTTVTGSQVVTITPAPLTVTAKSYYIYVGGAAPTNYEYTVTGLVSGEKLSTIPTVACPTADVSKVGAYPITITGATATNNYTLSCVNGSLNVVNYADEPQSDFSSGSEINSSDLQRLAAQNKALTVTDNGGAKLKFSPEALKELAKGGNKITITISDAGDKLNEEQKKIVGDRPVFDLTVMSGKTIISDFGGGTVEVTLPYVLKENENPDLICVWLLGEDGSLTPVFGSYDPVSKTLRFTTKHFSRYVVGEWINCFTDVAKGAWYYESVAKTNMGGLMSGVSKHSFAPNANATRAMQVSMLYRMAGSPAVGSEGSKWYDNARTWAMAQDVSDGCNMEENITREQLVTMLYRYAKGEKIQGDLSGFADADAISDFARESMNWAVAKGIIHGDAGRLKPQGNATRAEIATVFKYFMGMNK